MVRLLIYLKICLIPDQISFTETIHTTPCVHWDKLPTFNIKNILIHLLVLYMNNHPCMWYFNDPSQPPSCVCVVNKLITSGLCVLIIRLTVLVKKLIKVY